jgi:hypothetical protein
LIAVDKHVDSKHFSPLLRNKTTSISPTPSQLFLHDVQCEFACPRKLQDSSL